MCVGIYVYIHGYVYQNKYINIYTYTANELSISISHKRLVFVGLFYERDPHKHTALLQKFFLTEMAAKNKTNDRS